MNDRNENDELALLAKKLAPARINQTLAFSALFQLVHEAIKIQVLDRTKSFFGYSDLFGDGIWINGTYGKEDYSRSVLKLDSESHFKASLKWLSQMDAISEDDIPQLDVIYRYRHDLTHRLSKYLIDIDHEPDVNLLVNGVKILQKISRFWTQVEIESGSFEHLGDVTVDDAISAQLLLVQMCIDAYLELHSE